MAVKRIGILTGGGDVPGLNAVIKSATYRSSENNIEIVGLRRGWEALTHLNIDDPASRARYVIQLTRENTRTIDRHGGTVLHTSSHQPRQNTKSTHPSGRQGLSGLSGQRRRRDQDLGPLHPSAYQPLGSRHRTPDRDRRG